VRATFKNVRNSVLTRWTGMTKRTASVGCHLSPCIIMTTMIL